MSLSRLSNGERIASISSILLFVFMFFHWFGVEATNNSNLLFAIRAGGPGKNSWEALEYIPIILVITNIATLAMVALRLTNAARKLSALVNALVAILGLVSALLILFRIISPPTFYTQGVITFEGTIQFPIFIALLAAAGVAFGACLGMREEGISLSGLRPRDEPNQASRRPTPFFRG